LGPAALRRKAEKKAPLVPLVWSEIGEGNEMKPQAGLYATLPRVRSLDKKRGKARQIRVAPRKTKANKRK